MAYYKRVFAKPCKYKGIVFRSHLERDFAKYMAKNKIEWEYEKHKFELLPREEYFDNTENKKHILRSVVFIPDFYLPQYNLIVEIKGEPYDTRLFRLKLRLFKSKFADRDIVVVKSRNEFEKLKQILNNNYKEKGE